MADIGNGHQHAPTLTTPHLGGLTVDCVIEIARVLTIDGDQRYLQLFG